jgi:GT2 family glycosyltransferase
MEGWLKVKSILLTSFVLQFFLKYALNPRNSYRIKKAGLQLSIIIVNFNVKYFLEQCLYAALKACAHIEAEIFVVDNLSTDGSREYLAPKFPSVHFRWNTSNMGFGKANNSVLKEAAGSHILFLNPDCIVPEDCFTKCLAFFATHENCGGLGVRMIDGSGSFLKESKRGFPDPLTSLYKMTGLAAVFPSSKSFGSYYAGHLPQNETNEVEVLAGAFMMLSKKAINATGGFDEDFFMYGEDIDLSYRIKKAGLSNYYFAGTTIIHFKGESTQKISADYIRQFYGAMQLFVKKHYAQKSNLLLMNMAIKAGQDLAMLKKAIVKKKKKERVNSAPIFTAVVASQQKFNDCVALIKHASPPVLLAGRIAIDARDQSAAIGNLSAIKSLIRQNHIKQLLFCEGDLSFAAIISQVEEIGPLTTFLFHATNSTSMVGSNDKNARGIFISKP